MADHTITYFPVGNGDTSLITLTDKTTFVIDLNVTEAVSDEDAPARYDVHAHLIKEARSDSDGRPHVDGYLLSHPDQDHARGFATVFYTGDLSAYGASHKKAGRIIIDELWFAPRVFAPWEEKDLCEDAKLFKKEAERRIAAYLKDKAAAAQPGNRIRIIGYSNNPELNGLEALIVVPGTRVNVINGSAKEDYSFFVHAPFKKDTDDKDNGRNETSVVVQASFTVDGCDGAACALFGGDAPCAVWEDIVDKSEAQTLEWDLLLAPHHCSWTFFSELPSEENKPSKKILDFLKNQKRKGAMIIASSKPIRDDDDNPPHHQAAKLYRKEVGEDRFFCTSEHPNEKKPLPLYFRMTKNGPQKDDYSKGSQIVSSAALAATVSTPKTYGRGA